MGGKESTLGSPVKHMFAMHGLWRQAEPVRLAGAGAGRRSGVAALMAEAAAGPR